MKKIVMLMLTLVLALTACFAQAEISVSKKDLNITRGLDGNVTNVLVILQDGDVTDTMMIASINSRTGRAVMTRLDGNLVLDVMQAGETALKDVYMLGKEKSRGLLVASTINKHLSLNINTYIALDISVLPELANAVGQLNMPLDIEEGNALGLWEGTHGLTGEQILTYVRLRLASDSPARSRGYDALMQLLYQGLHSGDLSGMMGLGTKLLKSMDSNLNALNALTLVSAVQAGDDRRELLLPAQEHITSGDPLKADTAAMQALLYANLYE